jgi:hypothetical protein
MAASGVLLRSGMAAARQAVRCQVLQPNGSGLAMRTSPSRRTRIPAHHHVPCSATSHLAAGQKAAPAARPATVLAASFDAIADRQLRASTRQLRCAARIKCKTTLQHRAAARPGRQRTGTSRMQPCCALCMRSRRCMPHSDSEATHYVSVNCKCIRSSSQAAQPARPYSSG